MTETHTHTHTQREREERREKGGGEGSGIGEAFFLWKRTALGFPRNGREKETDGQGYGGECREIILWDHLRPAEDVGAAAAGGGRGRCHGNECFCPLPPSPKIEKEITKGEKIFSLGILYP